MSKIPAVLLLLTVFLSGCGPEITADGKVDREFDWSSDVQAVTISADGTTVFAAYEDKIRAYDAASGDDLWSVYARNDNAVFNAHAVAAAGNMLCTATKDRVDVWQLSTVNGTLIRGVETPGLSAVALSGDGRCLAVLAGGCKVYEVSTGSELRSFGGDYTDVALSADGRLLALGTDSNGIAKVKICNLLSSASKTVDGAGDDSFLLGRPGVITGLAFSSDDRALVVSSVMELRVFDVSSGAKTFEVDGAGASNQVLQFLDDTHLLATNLKHNWQEFRIGSTVVVSLSDGRMTPYPMAKAAAYRNGLLVIHSERADVYVVKPRLH